jgi:hypothetical protein
MKVKDLIAELSKMDQNLEVCCYSEDAFAATDNNGVRAFDIVSVGPTAANRIRDKNGLPSLVILDSEHPRKIALIEISSDS